MTAIIRFPILFLILGLTAAQDFPVTEIELRGDPQTARVRPLESLVLQVLVYGEIEENGQRRRIRLQRDGAHIEISQQDAGWLSKPFRFQGSEAEPFYQKENANLAEILLSRATGDLVLQDAVLYTAPRRPGTYRVQAELDGKRSEIRLQVDSRAPSIRPQESASFPPERDPGQPYRRLAEHYAPFIAQETWFDPKSDYLARFDFDRDWRGDNNWDNADSGSSQAYVYYAAMETQTHWFLIFDIFHPRDYSDKCLAGTCHENDSEGLILTVQKDGSPFGRPQAMETLAHNNIYSYRIDDNIGSGAHGFDGNAELYQGSHPAIFIESGGHGVYGTQDRSSRYRLDRDEFTAGTGVTYIYKGTADRPEHPDDRLVGYELLPALSHLWQRAHEADGRREDTFDDYFPYQPYGGRPGTVYAEIAGSFLGRKQGRNKAKPFWGWSDRRTKDRKILATGQWSLDPAYGVSQNLSFPPPFSLDYLYNPYLGTGAVPVMGPDAPPLRDFPSSSRERGEGPEVREYDGFFSVPGPDYAPDARQGRIDLRLQVDDELEVALRQDRVSFVLISGKPPLDLGTVHTQLLPDTELSSFELEKVDGRGRVTLLQAPEWDNDFTARLRISDPRGGADRYHIRLLWERQPPGVEADPDQDLEDQTGMWREVFPDDKRLALGDGREGTIELRLRVDGKALLRLTDGRAFSQVVNGRPLQVDSFSFSEPIPNWPVSLSLEKSQGRGEVLLLEKPWAGNGFSAIFEIDDPDRGDDLYAITLRWYR